MTQQPTRSRSGVRVLIWSISVGLLFAAISGIQSSGGAESNQAGASASLQTFFAPEAAFLGFLPGALFGALVGTLWGRPGFCGVLGFVLVTLLGGVAGLMAAGLLGADTRMVVSTNSVYVDHGASPAVLVGGAVFGLVLSALGAWRFAPPARSGDESQPSRLLRNSSE